MSKSLVVRPESKSNDVSWLARPEFAPQVAKVAQAATYSIYFRLIIRIIISTLIIVFLIFFSTSILKDIRNAQKTGLDQEKNEIEKCKESYYQNQCDAPDLPSFLVKECKRLQSCKDTVPRGESFTEVAFRYIPQRINDFTNSLSIKSIAVIVFLVLFMFWIQKMDF